MTATDTSFERVWRVPTRRWRRAGSPATWRAVRIRGRAEVRAGGRDGRRGGRAAPMREDTLFRIASVTKPIGGALALGLVEDGVLAPRRPDRALAARGGAPARARRARRAARPHRRGAAADHRPPPADATAGWGAVLEETPLQRGDDASAGVYPGPLHAADVRRRVRGAGRRPAARLPAGGGLALRHGHRRPRRAAGARGRQAAVRARRRARSPARSAWRRHELLDAATSTGSRRPTGRRPTASRCSTRRTAPSPARRRSRS